MNGKAIPIATCATCGKRSIVGLDPDIRQILFTGGGQALAGNEQAMNVGTHAGFVLRPSDHLRDAFLVVCVSCTRATHLRRSDIEAGGPVCHACREAPKDNWWTRAYAANRNPKPPKKFTCPDCGAVLYGPRDVEAEGYTRSFALSGFVPDPKQGPTRSLETPLQKDAHECCNYIGGECIVRERGPCRVLKGERCGWFERAVRPAGRLSGRVCAGCGGEVSKRHRFCGRCLRSRRRTARRELQHQDRVSHLTRDAPQAAPDATGDAVARPTPQGQGGVAAQQQIVDKGGSGAKNAGAVEREVA